MHPLCSAFLPFPLDSAPEAFLFFSEALSHPPGLVSLGFAHVCIRQVRNQGYEAGGGGLSYETTCDMTTQAVVFFSEAAPAGFGFLDGVVHTSLSTPAPKWS